MTGTKARERNPPLSQLDYLSERERHVLRLLAAGLTNREIAAQLGLTVGTVENLVARVLTKLNVNGRAQAAARAVELGLLPTAEQ